MREKIAFIYPGQGAQTVGVGKDFYENSKIAKEFFDEACQNVDFDLKSICFEENEDINKTEYTQPAMVSVSLMMTKELLERGIKPDVTAGLSLGEYAAIAVAKGFSYVDAVKLVRSRGLFMAEAEKDGDGLMCAILGLSNDVIEETISTIEGAYVANYNCEGQTVITGEKNAVTKAAELLKEKGAKRTIMLNVSGAFHSPLLSNAQKKLSDCLKTINYNKLEIPYVSNVTADLVSDSADIEALLTKQICMSVKWMQSVEKMISEGVRVFVEIGPKKTLASFIRKIDPTVSVYNINTYEDMLNFVDNMR